MRNKINFIDLFAGCGGLMDGFMQSGLYKHVASVEWEKAPVVTLKKRLKNKWSCTDVDSSVLYFDMQREQELFHGYDDPIYGANQGLDSLVNKKNGVDAIIGGPPCQAYSVAGRTKNRMVGDYRNYLFEHYIATVKRYDPKLFVFENVPGMISAMPDGTLITDLIKRDLDKIGFEIIENIKDYAVINTADYGVPQNRKRVILIGLNKKYFSNCQEILKDFYTNILTKYKEKQITLEEAIGDLPKLIPLEKPYKEGNRNVSHSLKNTECENVSWHIPRYSNFGDIEVFKLLTKDIESGNNEYTSINKLIEVYKERTGKDTKVHKYHVLRKDEPSTTILAHLHKDGFRFIHYDSEQARTITVREAARIQTFDDDFDFVCSMGAAYKMIGNAVPPKFSKKLALAIYDFLNKYREGE